MNIVLAISNLVSVHPSSIMSFAFSISVGTSHSSTIWSASAVAVSLFSAFSITSAAFIAPAPALCFYCLFCYFNCRPRKK